MKKLLLLLPFLLFASSIFAQDLLSEIDTTVAKSTDAAFKGIKIVNLESTKLAAKKDFYFVVAHRFGSVKDGFQGFFGLDNANTQLKFLYGLTDWLTVSAARSEQAYDFSVKYRLIQQEPDKAAVTVVMFNSIASNNTLHKSLYPKMEFSDRLSYVTQVLVSRKFSDRFSFEVAPTLFHDNFVVEDHQENLQYAVGLGGRYKLTKRWSVNMDYAAHLNRVAGSQFKNPLSVGVDLETGGHVFQMHFTSSQQIHEAGFLGNTTGDWTKGEIFFGFNLLRVF